jgi:hypothetical protein
LILSPINGEIGLLTFYEGKVFAATTFEFADGKISALYWVMNPDKLKVFEQLNDHLFHEQLSQTENVNRLD